MMKKIIGIFIIIFGLIFLAGIISFMFFSINPLDFVRDFFDPTKEVVSPNNNGSSVDPQNNSKTNTPNKSSQPKNVRTIIVDDNLLNNNNVPVKNNSVPVFQQSDNTVKESDLLKMAAAFAERFGTYSNQSNFANIIDLKMFMSTKMKLWADTYVADMRAKKNDNSLYYGVTTRAINQEMSLLDEDSGEARATVYTRRQEAAGFTNNITKSFSQEIVVNMIKENKSWKIDAVFWQ